jgi:hypothetical protein
MMSKKTTRRKVRQERVAVSPSPVDRSTPSRTYEFKPDYSYVIKDLRRIGTLAGVFITILFVLSFFLR